MLARHPGEVRPQPAVRVLLREHAAAFVVDREPRTSPVGERRVRALRVLLEALALLLG
jgi:hypothetical protein